MNDKKVPARTKRGALKIYLGAAPGSGKTCAMLNEAHGLVLAGRDVVIGIVEDHGREFTRALCDGLETIPRRHAAGLSTGELDTAAIISRQPETVLVDEFAHSNPRGEEHAKRWEDVEEILAAGIDVISTLNIQHLESLNDVINQITGISPQETVPDEVVRAANEIELVDVSPQLLRTRLSDGQIYKEARIAPALNNYFRVGNLTALRELALLWLADQVDEALASYRSEQDITDTWEARERVVVAIQNVAHAELLIRRGRRIASKSSAELHVVHVIFGDSFSSGGSSVAGSAQQLAKLQSLAQDVGARLHQVTGDSVPEALLNFARSVNATQLVLGVSPRRRLGVHWRGTVAEAVLRDSGKIDCHIVNLPSDKPSPLSPLLRPLHSLPRRAVSWVGAAVAFIALTALLQGIDGSALGTGTCSAFYFALILLVSMLAGLWPAVIIACASGLAVNWFFTEPLYTFDIAEPANAVILVVMVAIALAVGLQVRRTKIERHNAAIATRDAELLTVFSRAALNRRADVSPIDVVLRKLGETFGCHKAVLLDASGDVLSTWHASAASPRQSKHLHIPAKTHKREVETLVSSEDTTVQIVMEGPALSARDRALVAVVAGYLAGIVRRDKLSAEAARADAIAAADELRRALLSSVSHDLRTPLATAKLAVSSLRNSEIEFSPEDQEILLAETAASIDQLTLLVTNLLDHSRLSAGAVTARRDTVELYEVANRAIASCAFGHSKDQLGRIHIGSGLRGRTCCADSVLLERVLANLFDNALRYAPSGPVNVDAQVIDERVELSVSDEGPGISPEKQRELFQAFQRLGDTSNDNGVGLGLSVVRGFVEAMDGTITVEATPGATFILSFPLREEKSHD
ncbi:MAG: ATP-binding protein [Corynebacterium sp.]|nr:ATP-binding protein [Corynebacterium sp.]